MVKPCKIYKLLMEFNLFVLCFLYPLFCTWWYLLIEDTPTFGRKLTVGACPYREFGNPRTKSPGHKVNLMQYLCSYIMASQRLQGCAEKGSHKFWHAWWDQLLPSLRHQSCARERNTHWEMIMGACFMSWQVHAPTSNPLSMFVNQLQRDAMASTVKVIVVVASSSAAANVRGVPPYIIVLGLPVEAPAQRCEYECSRGTHPF